MGYRGSFGGELAVDGQVGGDDGGDVELSLGLGAGREAHAGAERGGVEEAPEGRGLDLHLVPAVAGRSEGMARRRFS